MQNKCKFYRSIGGCAKANDENDLGDCVFENGIMKENTAIHCSESEQRFGVFEKLILKNIGKFAK